MLSFFDRLMECLGTETKAQLKMAAGRLPDMTSGAELARTRSLSAQHL